MKYHIAAIEHQALTDFNNGDEAAINHLFKRYYKSLIYFSLQLIQDKMAAEDIAVDVFIKLLKKKKSLISIQSYKGFCLPQPGMLVLIF